MDDDHADIMDVERRIRELKHAQQAQREETRRLHVEQAEQARLRLEETQRQERNREAQRIRELEDVQRELRALRERRPGHTCVMCKFISLCVREDYLLFVLTRIMPVLPGNRTRC